MNNRLDTMIVAHSTVSAHECGLKTNEKTLQLARELIAAEAELVRLRDAIAKSIEAHSMYFAPGETPRTLAILQAVSEVA